MPDHEETSEDPLQVIHDTLVCDDRDWSRDEPMAVIFGIACGWPTVLLAAKTYGSVFYDKLPPSIARGKW